MSREILKLSSLVRNVPGLTSVEVSPVSDSKRSHSLPALPGDKRSVTTRLWAQLRDEESMHRGWVWIKRKNSNWLLRILGNGPFSGLEALFLPVLRLAAQPCVLAKTDELASTMRY